MHDWLRENNYPYHNVVVFDFYNALTGPDNHHRFVDGNIEHVFVPGMDISYYPSAPGDDHPSQLGNRKATQEFITLLNVFYHRWKSSTPLQVETPPQVSATTPVKTQAAIDLTPESVGLIDDFEAGEPFNWQPYWDEATQTEIHCALESGTGIDGSTSLKITFNVAAEN